MKRTLAALTLAVALTFVSSPAGPLAKPGEVTAQAQSERPPAAPGPHERNPEAKKAIDLIKSPYCPGLMLEVCPSPGGAALRDTIEMMAEAGIKHDSIVESIISRYGEEWRALPKSTGEALLAWAIPPLVLVGSVALLVLVLRRIRRPAGSPPSPEVSEEERARLDAALRALEAEEETQF